MRKKSSQQIPLREIYLCTTPLRYAPRREGSGMTVRLADLLGEAPAGPAPEVMGVTCDSRQVKAGYVFVAVPGTKADGRAFVADAVNRGCSAIVAEAAIEPAPDVPVFTVPDARVALADLAARFHGRPTEKLNVVGVTGTKGKSTTTYLIRSILEAAGERSGLLGTIQYAIAGRILPSPLTTPPADELQKHFADMVAAGCRSAVMEVSSIALDQKRTHALHFAAGVLTNLQRDHLDYHGTPEAYRDAKARLFEDLPARGVAAINADDPAAAFFASKSKARVVTYGVERPADVTGKVEEMTFQGLKVRVKFPGEELLVSSRLLGLHNAQNLLAAASTAWAMGYDFDHIKGGLEALAAVPGRLEAVDAGQPFLVLVDYAHTEESLRNVLGSLRRLRAGGGGRILVVFGCGGDRDRGKRPLMGRAVEDLSDFFIVTSDNPRTEDPLAIIREVEAGIENHSRYLVEPDRRAAIKIALGMARRDDLVLIAGKGHENYQIVGRETKAFDDRTVAREILKESGRTKARE
ncbi:MAG TPA: UDP-N-acetylmuramoyl-L-alanyl-D-glutamate--2,6-diaminopimelate ligase [Candidatus Eisenbacteria bacterium]|nr:UDP-N-acetylmuramoyl-L-alanyl-D-glutamate--2,6-diaminopimelate ligase [Candidatus Eisenbacteria bacterium]